MYGTENSGVRPTGRRRVDRTLVAAVLLGLAVAFVAAPAAREGDTVDVRYAVTSEWETGFTGELIVTNNANWPIADWRLSFRFAPAITSVWNAAIRSRVDSRYVLGPTGASWDDGQLVPGESVAIGFVASGSPSDVPTAVALNEMPVVLNGASLAPKPAASSPAPAPAWPQPVFAPYFDATAWPPLDFVAVAREFGVRHFRVGFVVAGAATPPAPSWGGYYSAETPYRPADVDALRALGGDIAVVFGGAIGTELAVAATSVEELTAAYRSVIDANGARVVDFDIEGPWLAHRESITRRSQALAALRQAFAAEGRPLDVWLTLPVLPGGLTADGLNVVRSALAHGVVLNGVNGMAMDYGDQAAPQPEGRMGLYAIEVARNLHRQLQALLAEYAGPRTAAEVWGMTGITPMIGLNDVVTEVFRESDADQVVAFAREQRLGLLSFWSLNRDRPCDPPRTTVSPGCSSVAQDPYAFTRIFHSATTAVPEAPRGLTIEIEER